MAQTIKHRRGSVASVRNITSFGEAEIVIGSGSVDSKVDGPIVYIGRSSIHPQQTIMFQYLKCIRVGDYHQ